MRQIKLAEALLRRKELQEKVDQLRKINEQELYQIKGERKNVTENIDDIVMKVPIIQLTQVTHAFDWHSKRLRQIDALIQQANWTTVIETDETNMEEYIEPPHLSESRQIR